MSGRIIAIGDIHGCSKALAALVEAIGPGPDDTLVPLGDYIDRGPDSRGVLDQLISLGERCLVVPLMGNHYYEPDRLLYEQSWGGLRWASLPPRSEPHRSGKVALVGHTAQKSGEVLDLGYLKCIDTFCHGGGWLTALEVETGRVWQADREGRLRA